MSGFLFSTSDQPHLGRTGAILKRYPEIRRLMGRNPWTALIMLVLFVAQVTIAIAFGQLGFGHVWLALIVAYCFGAFANHCLYVVIHEASHNLIFANRWLNKVVAILADLPNLIPAAIGFSVYHLKHHAHQGEYDKDMDLSSEWEAQLIGNAWYMKALWLLLFPVFETTRLLRVDRKPLLSPWFALSIALAAAFASALYVIGGGIALIYLGASMFFSVGLHPLGGRWIQEHYTNDISQETFSYYGPLNLLALNVGYHNEHHDFPSIPWNRLPELRRIAPEFYISLQSYASWTRLVCSFVFNPEYSLHSRVMRAPKTPPLTLVPSTINPTT
ncbi:fatty acid desaturase [Devosia sp. CAU 1758]